MVERSETKGQSSLQAGVVIASRRRHALDQEIAGREKLAVQTKAKVANRADLGRTHVQKADRTAETRLRNETAGAAVACGPRRRRARGNGLGKRGSSTGRRRQRGRSRGHCGRTRLSKGKACREKNGDKESGHCRLNSHS
jgi:hypothetical protein